MKVTQVYGRYGSFTICSKCGWFPKGMFDIFASVCPDCGEYTNRKVGRFLMEKKEGFFHGLTYTRLKFEEK